MDLAKKVANDSFLIEGLLKIGYKIENKILAMEDALNWIKYTGDVTILPKLGSVDNCWPMLSIFFTEYKYHITRVVTENCNLLEEFRRHSCMQCVKQGELMKMRGNEEFSKEKFEIAVIYYTRAIEYRPENHLLYGNRALCFLRMGQFRNALSDGKRAIVLKNTWPKVGHQIRIQLKLFMKAGLTYLETHQHLLLGHHLTLWKQKEVSEKLSTKWQMVAIRIKRWQMRL